MVAESRNEGDLEATATMMLSKDEVPEDLTVESKKLRLEILVFEDLMVRLDPECQMFTRNEAKTSCV